MELTPEENLNKAKFHYKAEVYALLKPLERYGQKEYCEGILPLLVKLAVDMHRQANGEDIPIYVNKPTYTP